MTILYSIHPDAPVHMAEIPWPVTAIRPSHTEWSRLARSPSDPPTPVSWVAGNTSAPRQPQLRWASTRKHLHCLLGCSFPSVTLQLICIRPPFKWTPDSSSKSRNKFFVSSHPQTYSSRSFPHLSKQQFHLPIRSGQETMKPSTSTYLSLHIYMLTVPFYRIFKEIPDLEPLI